MSDGYLPIEDHGAIGNLRTVALVGRDGTVDWWPAPGLGDPSVFASLLDHRRGGRFRIGAVGAGSGEQRYATHTNVLETSFTVGEATLVVTDCMPLRGDLTGTGGSTAEPELLRVLRADGGDVEVELEWSPRFRYGNGRPDIRAVDGGFVASSDDDSLSLAGVARDEAELVRDDGATTLHATFTLAAGERRALLSRWGTHPPSCGIEQADGVVGQTVEAWRRWVHDAEATGTRDWAAPHQELIIRSELAIKLLCNGETGAIAAAPTTSLPEEIGGVRNWDYRYSWIRDAAMAAQALHVLGHDAEARAFVDWAERVAQAHRQESRTIQIVYGLDGSTELDEHDLPNLEGYRRSAPVRVGNGAVDQLQLDIFGELISAVHELVRMGDEVGEDVLAFLPAVADDACRRWRDPDFGLWELRNGPFHFVHAKAMVWTGLDRAVALAEDGVIHGEVARWRASRDEIREDILARGFDPELGAFRQSYERAVPDAANLLLPLLELVDFDDPRVQANLDTTLERLTEDGLVHRYLVDDGVAGGEGAFVLCNFWLVDALAMGGRLDEARERFERLVGHANHLGLYSEEIDPATGSFLGNFPQAFSHIGLINSALYLAYAEGREIPVPAPIGSDEHRAERSRSDPS